MTSRPEKLLVLVVLEVDQGREQEDHVPALIHDRRVAVVAADFAGEFMGDGFFGRVVPFQVVMPMDKVDVRLVEDCGPLERSGCAGLVATTVHVKEDEEGLCVRWITYHAATDT